MRIPLLLIALLIVLGASLLLGLSYFYSPDLLACGQFHQVAHSGSGSVSLFTLRDGRRVLRLTNLKTEMRSDLVVLLITAHDAFDNESVENSRRVSLGALNPRDDQREYELPPHINPRDFHAVTIWSSKYKVNFATAFLRHCSE